MSDDLLLHWIQECVAAGRFYFSDHALERHPLQEGFLPQDVVTAIQRGTIIEHYEAESRCIVCGDVPGLALRSDFHGRFIHAVIQYDRVSQLVIITNYRPRLDKWDTPQRRRQYPARTRERN